MPSLRGLLKARLPEVYRVAVVKAAAETRLDEESFPDACPFTLDQILDDAFFPE